MREGFVFRSADIFLKPAPFFRQAHEGSLMEAVLFFLTGLCIHSILAGVVIWRGMGSFFCSVPFIATTPTGAHSIIAAMAGCFLFGIIFTVVAGAAIHLTAMVCGAKNDIKETYRAILYGATPALLIGWIPLAVIIAIPWSLVIITIGIGEFQNISAARAVTAVFIPAVLLTIVCSFVIAPLLFGYDYSRFFSLPCH